MSRDQLLEYIIRILNRTGVRELQMIYRFVLHLVE